MEELGRDGGAVRVGGDDDAGEGVCVEHLPDRAHRGGAREWWRGDAGTDEEELGDDDTDIWVVRGQIGEKSSVGV